MNETSIVPGLIVLGIGVLVGLVAAWSLKRKSPAKELAGADGTAGLEDLRLKITDLETRRDEIYQQLRSDADEELSSADRASLEKSAARTLRDLDQARAKLKKSPATKASHKAAKGKPRKEPPPPQAPAPQGALRHPLLLGFVFGAGMVGLVALLIFWALRDAKPDPQQMAQSQQMAAQSQPQNAAAQGAGGSQEPLPPGVARRLGELQARLQANPNDLAALKETAHLLLTAGRLVDAYRITEPILQNRPSDPDGLYIQAFVRFAMGQVDLSLGLLDRVLTASPSYTDAFVLKGLVLLRSGDRDSAIANWEQGIQAAGGSHPGLEHLLDRARQGLSVEEILSLDAAAGSGPAPEEPSSDVYRVRIALAPGTVPSAQGTLFVFLRGAEPGPPAAVRRVMNPTFPMDLSLGQGDSMLGGPLPDAGTLSVRLDTDGNASTTSEADLTAQGAATRGSTTDLVLGR